MSLRVHHIVPHSLADDYGIKPNYTIKAINGNVINDFLDLYYHSSDDELEIECATDKGEPITYHVHQQWNSPLGIEPEPHICRLCINDCIFCFVDQMRPGLRETLYIKDDDYRLSLAFGNFITLTNLISKDYDRIINQHLSPLYISIHTTNPSLHKKMLRYKHDFNIYKALSILSENNIELHTQIVVVPGYNDGEELVRTLQDLTSDRLKVASVGIVPIGLTKFRDKELNLEPVSPQNATEILELAKDFPKTYCSDEFYILANKPFPPENSYDGYPQLENGIGMCRLLIENWIANRNRFVRYLKRNKQKLLFVTGTLSYHLISQLAAEINGYFKESLVRVESVRNDFFGESVTVTGLLTIEDIKAQISAEKNEIVVLSSSMFNDNDLSLDDVYKYDLRNVLRSDIMIIEEDFYSWEQI